MPPRDPAHHDIVIEFCVPCDFRPQALALTRGLVDGWAHVFGEIRLEPSSGGRFEITLDGDLIFSKAALDRHPEPGEVASLVAERIGPPLAVA